MELDERKQKILKAIVQDYIATAEPVGSRTISRKFELGVSPATIRNEMADLEEMGLIEQPHTSAGRIPSDKGYRYYVDYLIDDTELSSSQREHIDREFAGHVSEVREVIESASKLISQITNLTSIVTGPHSRNSALQKLYFLPYKTGQAILVTVKDNGQVENNIVDIGDDTTAEELQILATMFNDKIGVTKVKDLSRSFLQEIYRELSQKRRMIDGVVGILGRVLQEGGEAEKVYLGGALNMLNHPEFKDLGKMRLFLEVFEEDKKLRKLLHHAEKGPVVRIGLENNDEVFQDCSVITATYHINGRQIGSVGVLGPTRLDYGKTIAIVNYLTNSLTELLTSRFRQLGP
ncbi:MAG: heat-inducible transcriptional repressor HrcA [Gracilibacteraceae bacterium]|nr:heat-inducible transcriptional repressor HrcA [Gracilibacteraceae bacterium]